MKKDLMEILCCPMCKGDIALLVEEEYENDVDKGKLYCQKCNTYYPIEDGVPNLLPPGYK